MRIYFFFIIGFMAISGCTFGQNTNSYIISFSEKNGSYKLGAAYETGVTPRIQQYVNAWLKQNKLKPGRYLTTGTNIVLKDKSKVYLRINAEQLFIKFNKTESTDTTYANLKHMCDDLKSLVAGEVLKIKTGSFAAYPPFSLPNTVLSPSFSPGDKIRFSLVRYPLCLIH